MSCSALCAENLNYAGVAVGIVLFGALLFFFFPFIGAYRWYRGERHTIEDYSVSLDCAYVPLPACCILLIILQIPVSLVISGSPGSSYTSVHL